MPKISQDLSDFLEGGVSILVGTADDRARPECTRAAGIHVDRAADRVTLYVPTAGADQTLANLRANARIAVTCSRPHDHRTYQLKGRVVRIADTTAEERERQRRWLAAFVEQLAIIGIARSVARRWRVEPSVAVEIELGELFEQTPGPGAGRPLGSAA